MRKEELFCDICIAKVETLYYLDVYTNNERTFNVELCEVCYRRLERRVKDYIEKSVEELRCSQGTTVSGM